MEEKLNICFIGKNLETYNHKKIEPIKNGESLKRIHNENKYKMAFKTGDERSISEKKTSKESDKIFNTTKKINTSKVKKTIG